MGKKKGIAGSSESTESYKRYIDLLAPLFSFEKVDRFQLACVLLRVGEGDEVGMDSLEESREVLEDLIRFNQMNLPEGVFPDPEKTRWRLHLLTYVHLHEMDAPYQMLANLLRVRADLSYDLHPFHDATRSEGEFQKGEKTTSRPSPGIKIREIKRLAELACLSGVGQAFNDFYYSALRNAIAHSDYVLVGEELHLMKDRLPHHKNPKKMTSVLNFDRLGDIISRSYDFYSVFFTLQALARREFVKIKGSCFPLDHARKGLVEFLVDAQGLLNGFTIHWPNGRESTFRRRQAGIEMSNVSILEDGSVGFVYGAEHQEREAFSPLVPRGSTPHYTPCEGQTEPPRWPE